MRDPFVQEVLGVVSRAGPHEQRIRDAMCCVKHFKTQIAAGLTLNKKEARAKFMLRDSYAFYPYKQSGGYVIPYIVAIREAAVQHGALGDLRDELRQKEAERRAAQELLRQRQLADQAERNRRKLVLADYLAKHGLTVKVS
jgi:hypothetical protein